MCVSLVPWQEATPIRAAMSISWSTWEPGRSLLDLARLQRKLEQLLTVKVDVVSARGLRDRVRETVLRDTLPL